MGNVAKYNLFKGISTALTICTPIVTLACSGEFFIHKSDTAISAAGIFTLLILALLFKDKIVEKWKVPSAFVVSASVLVLILLVEHIMLPIKNVCIATMIASGVDEVTFKRFYKNLEIVLPKEAESFKHVGFIFTSTNTLNTKIADKGGTV